MMQNNPPQITRRQLLLLSLGGATAGVGLAAGIYVANQRQKEAEETFASLLRTNPPDGKIAYADGNEIKILSASNIADKARPDETFQVERDVKKLAWVNETEIVFTSKIGSSNTLGTPPSKDRKFEFTVVSEGVFKLDVKTGKITTLLDPYSDAVKPLFGDVRQKDADKEVELEEFMNSEKPGSRIVLGDAAAIQVQQIGSGKDGAILVKINDDWFKLANEGGKVERAVRISDVAVNQAVSRDGLFKLVHGHGDNASLGDLLDGKTPVRLTDSSETVSGIVIAEGATTEACWIQEK